ncbi:MAG: hypothetical protein Q7T55_01560 [Solirubrobacteraceae bacterium]|nr:hypothetical protein [Solirubrobacteraceae bacterium]
MQTTLFSFCFLGHMTIYHFRILRNGQGLVHPDGLDLADMNEAWDEATIAFAEMVRDVDGSMAVGDRLSIEVQDEQRTTLRTISLTVSDVSDRKKF